MSRAARAGFFAAPAVLLAVVLMAPPQGMSVEAWRTAGVAAAMAILWVTEAIPIPATALLPLVLFPLLGVASAKDAAAPYANPVIYLFMGGFFLALSCQRWRLHQRMALHIIGLTGSRVTRVLGGIMAATAFISMWVSNSATAVMMLPIAMSVVELLRDRLGDDDPRAVEGLGLALMLGVAYASSIGGVGTLVGTPPNALLAGFLSETYGVHIGFSQWMLLGVPLVVVGTVLTHGILARMCLPDPKLEVPGLQAEIQSELAKLGPLTRGEISVAAVFALAAFLWVAQPLLKPFVPGLSDTTVAIVFLSELASNTATAATFLPVVASVSLGMGQNPMLLAIATTLAASCAFMLPVGTPPNAVAYATGLVPMPRMLRIGLWVNILFIILIPLAVFTLAVWVFGIVPGQLPP